jgi:hypothetical protein
MQDKDRQPLAAFIQKYQVKNVEGQGTSITKVPRSRVRIK